jgi:hypothetical protein
MIFNKDCMAISLAESFHPFNDSSLYVDMYNFLGCLPLHFNLYILSYFHVTGSRNSILLYQIWTVS